MMSKRKYIHEIFSEETKYKYLKQYLVIHQNIPSSMLSNLGSSIFIENTAYLKWKSYFFVVFKTNRKSFIDFIKLGNTQTSGRIIIIDKNNL